MRHGYPKREPQRSTQNPSRCGRQSPQDQSTRTRSRLFPEPLRHPPLDLLLAHGAPLRHVLEAPLDLLANVYVVLDLFVGRRIGNLVEQLLHLLLGRSHLVAPFKPLTIPVFRCGFPCGGLWHMASRRSRRNRGVRLSALKHDLPIDLFAVGNRHNLDRSLPVGDHVQHQVIANTDSVPFASVEFIRPGGVWLVSQGQQVIDDLVVDSARKFLQLFFRRSFEENGVRHQRLFRSRWARYSSIERDGSLARCFRIARSMRSSRNSLSARSRSMITARSFLESAQKAFQNASMVASAVVMVRPLPCGRAAIIPHVVYRSRYGPMRCEKRLVDATAHSMNGLG